MFDSFFAAKAPVYSPLEFGAPTLDRPFGVALWPLFERVFTPLVGFKPQDFEFTPGVTPMSTFKVTAISLITYYIVVFGGREIMRGLSAKKLNGLFMIHNFYLTAISGILLALFLEQLIPTLVRHGVFYTICSYDGGWTNKLVILYYLNYLTKFLELLDTVFLFLKKKPLTFLHTYHHGATALLCYTQLVGHTSVSWVPITLNLMVHVVMYWYYFQSARGIRIWWKRYITVLQITQFVVDLGKFSPPPFQRTSIIISNLSRIRILRFLHLFHRRLLPAHAQSRHLRRRGIRCNRRYLHSFLLPASLHLLLRGHLSPPGTKAKRPSNECA